MQKRLFGLFFLAFIASAVSVSALPDLTISNLSVYVNPVNTTSCYVSITAVTLNMGNSSATNSTTKISLDAMYTLRTLPSLIPGAFFSSNWVTYTSAGTHVASAFADSPMVIAESNELNNQRNTTFTCSPNSNQTHLSCLSNTCTRVQGNGTNECSPEGGVCGNVTHLECRYNTCSVIQGPGTNTCSPQGSQCGLGHLECRNSACVNVTGGGSNQCASINKTCATPIGNATKVNPTNITAIRKSPPTFFQRIFGWLFG